MSAVHQFHPVLAPDDAMSDHVFALRARFREWGYDSQAYAVEAKDGVDGETRSYRELFRVRGGLSGECQIHLGRWRLRPSAGGLPYRRG